MTKPISSETKEAPMNQPMVFTPTRPMAALSSIWAMPTTRVENTSGAMIILIRRRKTSVKIESASAVCFSWAGSVMVRFSTKPVSTPPIMAAITNRVKRFFMVGGLGRRGAIGIAPEGRSREGACEVAQITRDDRFLGGSLSPECWNIRLAGLSGARSRAMSNAPGQR